MESSIIAGIIDAICPQGHDLGAVLTTETSHTLGEKTPVSDLSNLGVDDVITLERST